MKFVKLILAALILAFLSACTSTSEDGVTISKSWWFVQADAPQTQANS